MYAAAAGLTRQNLQPHADAIRLSARRWSTSVMAKPSSAMLLPTCSMVGAYGLKPSMIRVMKFGEAAAGGAAAGGLASFTPVRLVMRRRPTGGCRAGRHGLRAQTSGDRDGGGCL